MEPNTEKLTIEASEVALQNLHTSFNNLSGRDELQIRDDLVPTLENKTIEFIDEYGIKQIKTISAKLYVTMLELAEERFCALSKMHWITKVSVYDFAQNCTNIENYGEKKIKYLCALIFGCDRDLSMFITINSNILSRGLITPSEENHKSSEGNTIWTKDELEYTIAKYVTGKGQVTQVEVDKTTNIIKILIDSMILVFAGNYYFLTSVKMIDKNVSDAVMESTDLVIKLPAKDDLTLDQFKVLKNIASDNKKVSILYGPGGTGKTYSIAKLILANQCIPTLIVAPTNIASLELTNSLLYSGVDTSKLVGGRVMSIDAYLCSTKLQHAEIDLIICDESSMMSTYHASIFRSTFKKIIMMGDNVQLDPVGAGAPFTDIIDSELIPYNPLVKSMRTNNKAISRTLKNLRDEDGSDLMISKVIPLAKSRSKANSIIAKESLSNHTDEAVRHVNLLIETVVQRKDYKWIAYHNHVVESLNMLLLGIHYGNSSKAIYEAGHHLAMMTVMNKGEAEQYNKLHFDPFELSNHIGLELYWSGSTQRLDDNYQMCNSFPVTVADRNYLSITAMKYRDCAGPAVKQFRMSIAEFKSTFNSADHGVLKMSYARTIHKSQGATYDKVAYIVKGDNWVLVDGYPKDALEQSSAYTAISRAKTEAFTLSLHSLRNDSIMVVPSSKRKTVLKMMLVKRQPK